MLESIKTTVTLSTSFVDCGETNVKLEIKKEEETLNEDPLSMVTLIYENNLFKKCKLYYNILFLSHLFSWSFISAGLSFLRLLA